MRVISGSLGGRQFKAPNGHKTHPMSEKMRGAIFNILGDIKGLTLLDVFTGSGAIAIEAISRGAHAVTAIDSSKSAYKTVSENLENLQITEKVRLSLANAATWSDNNSSQKFDIVVCDPPYGSVRYELLEKLANHTKPGGVFVLSLPPDDSFMLKSDLYKLIVTKNYGDSTLAFYKKTG